jgi:hypothetical protein
MDCPFIHVDWIASSYLVLLLLVNSWSTILQLAATK